MTSAEIHSYIDSHYADPILKTWTPSEYDMKHRYKPTPRSLAKLAADTEKENAKLKAIFDHQSSLKKNVHAVIDEISTYPQKIAELFYNTYVWNINYLDRCHETFLSAVDTLKEYDENAIKIADALEYKMKKRSCYYSNSGRRISSERYEALTDEEWKSFAEKFYTYSYEEGVYKGMIYPAKNIQNPAEFMKDVIDFFEAKKNDEVNDKGPAAYEDSIVHMTRNLESILTSIKSYFNGNKPTDCLTDAKWGYKGEFCGILTDGTSKISFKSFSAGGYNIQKYHFRFKITKLKH